MCACQVSWVSVSKELILSFAERVNRYYELNVPDMWILPNSHTLLTKNIDTNSYIASSTGPTSKQYLTFFKANFH